MERSHNKNEREKEREFIQPPGSQSLGIQQRRRILETVYSFLELAYTLSDALPPPAP
jgi:hypothetical protein